MAEPPHAPFFSRVEPARVRAYASDGFGRPAFTRMWNGVGAARFSLGPYTLAEGFLVNHLLTLNLGGDRVIEARFAGQPWRRAEAPRGTLSIWPARVEHSVRTHGAADVLFLELSPAFVDAVLQATPGLSPLEPVLAVRDEFAEHVLHALEAEARAGTALGAARAEKLASALVVHLCERERRRLPPQPAGRRRGARLHRVIDHIGAHLDRPLALRDLARVAGMEVYPFARAFKAFTGSSPYRYVLDARIARAKELLLDPGLSITEVAQRTGFTTPSHFSATFRRLASSSPRAFRDRAVRRR